MLAEKNFGTGKGGDSRGLRCRGDYILLNELLKNPEKIRYNDLVGLLEGNIELLRESGIGNHKNNIELIDTAISNTKFSEDELKILNQKREEFVSGYYGELLGWIEDDVIGNTDWIKGDIDKFHKITGDETKYQALIEANKPSSRAKALWFNKYCDTSKYNDSPRSGFYGLLSAKLNFVSKANAEIKKNEIDPELKINIIKYMLEVIDSFASFENTARGKFREYWRSQPLSYCISSSEVDEAADKFMDGYKQNLSELKEIKEEIKVLLSGLTSKK